MNKYDFTELKTYDFFQFLTRLKKLEIIKLYFPFITVLKLYPYQSNNEK